MTVSLWNLGSKRAPSSAGARAIHSGRTRPRCSTRCCRALRSTCRPAAGRSARAIPTPVEEVRLEIGFGGGEHLIAQAERASAHRLHRRRAVCQRHGQSARGDRAAELSNIRLHHGDAIDLLDWLPAASAGARRSDLSRSVAETAALEAALRAGRKRRGRSRACCGRAANSASPPTLPTMPPGRWRGCCARAEFDWTAERADDWRQPWPGFSGTRYEAKAKRDGRAPCYLTFRAELTPLTDARRNAACYGDLSRPSCRDLPEPHHALRGRWRQPLEIGEGRCRAPGSTCPAAGPRHDDGLRGRPAPAGRFAEDQDRIGPLAAHQPVDDLDRHGAKRRQRRDRFLVFACPWRIRRAPPRRACPPGAAPRRCAGRPSSRAAPRARRPPSRPLPARAGFRLGSRACAEASRRCCTTSVAWSRRSRNRRGGMSGAQPTFSASTPSFSARVDQRGEAVFGKPRGAIVGDACARPRGRRAAPARRSPARRCRRGRRSPADAPGSWSWRCRPDRLRAAARDAAAPARRPRCRRPGRAGARPRPAHCRPARGDCDSSARALASISSIRRPNTSSNRPTWSSLNCAAPSRKRCGDALERLGALLGASRAGRRLRARGSARRSGPCRKSDGIGATPSRPKCRIES